MTSFSLRQVKLRPGEQYRDELEVELSPLEYGGQRYLPVPEKVPAELEITRANTGTVFSLTGPAVQITTTSVGPAGIGTTASVTYKGATSSGGNAYAVVDLNIPALGVSVSNLTANGTPTTLSNGAQAGRN